MNIITYRSSSRSIVKISNISASNNFISRGSGSISGGSWEICGRAVFFTADFVGVSSKDKFGNFDVAGIANEASVLGSLGSCQISVSLLNIFKTFRNLGEFKLSY